MPIPPDDGSALRELAHTLWRRRILIVVVSLIFAGLGLLLSQYSTKYVSEGLLLMPSVSVDDYKRYETAMYNQPRLREFLELSEQTEHPAAELILRLLKNRARLSQAVRPEFAYTERDARQFGVRIEGQTGMLGVRLELNERERVPESPLRLLADYVRDTAIKIDLEARLLKWCTDYKTRELELRNQQIDGDFDIRQQRSKADGIRSIIERTPGASALGDRQVVSIDGGGERFLPPVAQIVAAEVMIAELEMAQVVRERNLAVAQLKKDYYCSAREAIGQPVTGRAFLTQLKGLAEKVLAGRDMSSDIIERVANVFEVQQRRWTSTYLERMRFVAAPEGAQVEMRKPSRLIGLVGGGVLGFLLGCGVALFLAWWRRNREVIVSDTD